MYKLTYQLLQQSDMISLPVDCDNGSCTRRREGIIRVNSNYTTCTCTVRVRERESRRERGGEESERGRDGECLQHRKGGNHQSEY